MFDDFHAAKCLPDVVAIRGTAMVLEQQRVVVRNQRNHPVTQRRRSRETVRCQRYGTKLYDHFGQQRLIKSTARRCKSGGDWRMRMDD